MNQEANVTDQSVAPSSLSAVVVILGGRSYLPRCLDALTQQAGVQGIEIIVPCDERIIDVPQLQKQYPAVRFMPVEGRQSYARLRALGVKQAREAIVALTEDHCTPRPDWAAQILKSHAASYAAVGGAVEKKEPDTALNWAFYMADYARYMNPVPEGRSKHLTDCNVSYKQKALHAIADLWATEFHEPTVHGALLERGETLWISPHIVVQQQRSVRFGDAVRDRFAFGRLFGSERAAAASAIRRLAYAGFALFLPPLLVGRVARHIIRKHRHAGAFLRSLPAQLLLAAVWSWGELAGYLTGRPGAFFLPESEQARAETSINKAATT
jgi:hypothetical protein